jgi:hypothetical protein
VFGLVRANSLSKYERARWETYKVYERSNWSCSSIASFHCTSIGHACLVHVDHPHDCPTAEPYALGRSTKAVLALQPHFIKIYIASCLLHAASATLEPKQVMEYLNLLSWTRAGCWPTELFTAQCSGRLNNGSSTSRKTIQHGRQQDRTDEVTSNRPDHSRLESQDALSHTTEIGISYPTA